MAELVWNGWGTKDKDKKSATNFTNYRLKISDFPAKRSICQTAETQRTQRKTVLKLKNLGYINRYRKILNVQSNF